MNNIVTDWALLRLILRNNSLFGSVLKSVDQNFAVSLNIMLIA